MTSKASKMTGSTFPSLRARMGDWWYYSTLMSFADVARWVTRTDQIHSNDRLRDWIQRELQEERIAEISDYLTKQPQHFFNAIIVGIHEGDPEWYPVEVGDSLVVGSPGLDEGARDSMGLLRLKGGEKVFAIDGQHRVEGIIAAIEKDPALASERLAVLVVGHHSTSNGRERTRRLFSTVNRNAKPVSKGEIVALDEDDQFAVVTRRLVEECDLLKGHRVAFRKDAAIKSSDHSAVTTILGLYDIVVTLSVPKVGGGLKVLRPLTARRPPDADLQLLYESQVEFWKTLQGAVPAILKVLSAKEDDGAAKEFRQGLGGNLLFRPAGQRAFTRAVRVLLNRKWSLADAVVALSKVPRELAGAPWADVLWDIAAKTMISKNSGLAQNLFLYMIGEQTEPTGYDLKKKFRAATGKTVLPQRLKATPPQPSKAAARPRTVRKKP